MCYICYGCKYVCLLEYMPDLQVPVYFWGGAPWGVVPLMFMSMLTERIEL